MTASAAAPRPDLDGLTTEQVDDRYADLDSRPTVEVLRALNEAEQEVPGAVRRVLPEVAALVEEVADRLRDGGRLVYVGAGTSGRLGTLDAAEIPPTFHVPPHVVQGVMAGGPAALVGATESVEDSAEAGAAAVDGLGLGPKDTVVGIAASGRTPFVLGAVRRAREAGALTAGVSCNTGSALGSAVDHRIEVEVGPEVVAGSTRLKAGSATKQILNLISTGVMVRGGKTYGNLMVDVTVSNAKLRDRAERLVVRITGVDRATAARALVAGGDRVKTAVVMIERGLDAAGATALLARHEDRIAPILRGQIRGQIE